MAGGNQATLKPKGQVQRKTGVSANIPPKKNMLIKEESVIVTTSLTTSLGSGTLGLQALGTDFRNKPK